MRDEMSCHFCEKSFLCKSALKIHIRTHTGEKPYQCSLCKYRCNLKTHLKRHVFVHHIRGKSAYKCGECYESFTNKSALYDHVKSHPGDKPYDLIEKSSQQQESMSGSDNFEFVECKETIKTEVIEDEEMVNDPLSAKLSVKEENDLSDVDREEFVEYKVKEEVLDEGDIDNPPQENDRTSVIDVDNVIHPISPNFDIKKIFNEYDSFSIKKDKSYFCEFCMKIFSDMSSFKSHIKEKMVDEKGNMIGIQTKCGLGAKRKTKYFLPLVNNKNDNYQEKTTKRFVDEGRKVETIIFCNFCGKTFKKPSYLKYHSRSHTGEKLYCCTFCEKNFAEKGSLTEHVKYQCTETILHCSSAKEKPSKQQELTAEILGDFKECNDTLTTEVKEEVEQENETNSDKSSNGECLTCDQCGKNFKDIAMLNVHKWIHG